MGNAPMGGMRNRRRAKPKGRGVAQAACNPAAARQHAEGANTTNVRGVDERKTDYELEATRRSRRYAKQDEAEQTTAGGLILASDSKEKPQSGVILAVGEGKLDKDGKLVPVPVKVGDRVVYGKYGGTEDRPSTARTCSSCAPIDLYGVFE